MGVHIAIIVIFYELWRILELL